LRFEVNIVSIADLCNTQ